MGWFSQGIVNKGIFAPAKPVFMRFNSHPVLQKIMACDTDARARPISRLEIAWGDQPRLGKQNLPGRIEVHPALRTEPACGYLRNVQQTVTADAYQLRSIEGKKVSRRLADSCGMCQFSETYRAPLPLIPQCPAQPKQADRERRDKLDVLRRKRIEGRPHIGQIERY
jgi:hypothetical protein